MKLEFECSVAETGEKVKQKERLLKEYGTVFWSISRNIWKIIEPHMNVIPVGVSIEDENIYEIEARAGEIIQLLSNSGVEAEMVDVNDNKLYIELDISLAHLYDPYYIVYVTTDVLLLKMLKERANNNGLISISDVIEIVELYRLLKILNAVSDVS